MQRADGEDALVELVRHLGVDLGPQRNFPQVTLEFYS